MPKTKVVFYKDDDGTVPMLEWLDSLPEKALDKCTIRIERLADRAMNCAGQRLIFCATASMSFGSVWAT